MEVKVVQVVHDDLGGPIRREQTGFVMRERPQGVAQMPQGSVDVPAFGTAELVPDGPAAAQQDLPNPFTGDAVAQADLF